MAATYRFSMQVIGRKAGRSATAAAAYRAGERLTDERTGLVHDYRARGGVFLAEIEVPDNAPAWMRDRSKLWNAIEQAEKRKDSQLARELLVSLPHNLTDQQRTELVRQFVREEFVRLGMVADVAIHRPDKEGDQRNHHAHVMLTMRGIEGDGFGAKERAWNEREWLEQLREKWAEHVNRSLEQAGLSERVDHRSLSDQGIDREPEPKIGVVATAMERRGEESKRGNQWREAKERNQERDELTAEAKIINLDLERIKRQDQARSAAEAQAKLAKIAARSQGQARAAIRDSAIRLRDLKEQRQDMQARHDAAFVGRGEERQRLRQEREDGRQALFDRFQHAIDQVWNPEAGPKEASPDRSALQAVNERLQVRESVFRDREQRMTGRIVNAMRLAPKGAGMAAVMRLALDPQARRQAFEREQRQEQARLAPPRQAQTAAPRPVTPSPKRWQSGQLKEQRREALAEYDRQTKAKGQAMNARHIFQRAGETAEKAAMRSLQQEAGERMDQAKAAMQAEAQPEQREATTGQVVRSEADAISSRNAVEVDESTWGYDPGAEQSEAIHGAAEQQGAAIEGGAGDPAEGKAADPAAAWTQQGQAEEGRALSPQEQRQVEIAAIREAREARDAAGREQGGRERER